MGSTWALSREQRFTKGWGIRYAQSLQKHFSSGAPCKTGVSLKDSSPNRERRLLAFLLSSGASEREWFSLYSQTTFPQAVHFNTSPFLVQPSIRASFRRKLCCPQWGHCISSPGLIVLQNSIFMNQARRSCHAMKRVSSFSGSSFLRSA